MTDHELLSAIGAIVEQKIEPVQADIKELKEGMKSLDNRVENLETSVRSLDNRVENLETSVRSLDNRMENLETSVRSLDNRVENLETSVRSLDNRMENLDNRVRNVELHLENVTDRNISILAENYVPAAKRYENATVQMETMQADIDVMKVVIREHDEKLQKIS